PQQALVQTFEQAGGAGKPRYGQVTVCYAASEAEARRIAYEHWPTSALKGQLGRELALPQYFEQAVATLREEDVAKVVTCGPDPERHVAAIQKFVDAGYDHVFVHQVGPDQEGFFAFYEREVLPRFH
ncbi:MAG: LLM class flavin-dependent oxidoreductase, partial [Thermomicrobiaceae bacterium]|nr:LLM class flavin-dependent oxidoreductase [Thermomicrobiaceae bacterium]